MDKTKKLEILQKLISLANNNPNEHEANSAARRACKLIVELNINFKVRSASDKIPPPKQQAPWTGPPKGSWNYKDFMSDIFGPGWEDEIFYTTKKQKSSSSEFTDEQIKEAKRKMEEEHAKQREAQRKAQEDYEKKRREQAEANRKFYERRYTYRTPGYDPNIRPPREIKIPKDRNPFYPNYPFGDVDPLLKVPRECVVCHKTVDTAYTGPLFECFECQFKAHNAESK